LYLALLFLAAALLYLPFSNNPLLFDDAGVLKPGLNGQALADQLQYSPFDFRSLPYASFSWSKTLLGEDIRIWRIENVLLHILTGWALFFLVRDLVSTLGGKSALQNDGFAFIAALLFILHPAAVYGPGYLVQRTIVMATLFGLLMCLCWIRNLEKQGAWGWGAVGFYFLAVTAKEHAVMLPALAVVLTIMWVPEWRSALWKRKAHLAAMSGIAIWVVLTVRHIIGASYEINATDMLVGQAPQMSHLLSVLTQSELFFRYILLWVLPNPLWMSGDMRVPFAQEWLGEYGLAMLAFIAWGITAMWLVFRRGRAGIFGFAMIFPWLLFFTEFAAVRVQESFVLYRSYLWASGMFVGIPVLLMYLDKKLAVVLGLGIAVALVPASLDRLSSFSHPVIFWQDAAQKVQGREHLNGVDRIYYNLGTSRMRAGDFDGAINALAHTIKLNPNSPFPYFNLGGAFEIKKMWKDAAIAYTQAIQFEAPELRGINANSHLGRGRALEAMGRADEAQNDFRLACRMANKGCDRVR
jgi:hypothetical protein